MTRAERGFSILSEGSDGAKRANGHRWYLIGNKSIMNVSWSDINNVQEGGDYSFRDGTITVTFAEVAIWKNNPNAQFQLMRKHPIQGAPRYVLGKRIEEE